MFMPINSESLAVRLKNQYVFLIFQVIVTGNDIWKWEAYIISMSFIYVPPHNNFYWGFISGFTTIENKQQQQKPS